LQKATIILCGRRGEWSTFERDVTYINNLIEEIMNFYILMKKNLSVLITFILLQQISINHSTDH